MRMSPPLSTAAAERVPAITVRPVPKAPRPLMRRVEVMCRMPDGTDADFSRLVPAVPAFDAAFAAFARGTLFHTETGLVAVEDLLPGDRMRTACGGLQTLLWRGATMLVPQDDRQDSRMGRLTRIAADAFGYGAPLPDLVLGPHARVVRRDRGLPGAEGAAVLVPASELVDGNSVVSLTPPSAVPVFHIAFAAHVRLEANGIEVESYNPGPGLSGALPPDALGLFLSLFPHLRRLSDFGPTALPRPAFTESESESDRHAA